MLQAVHNVAKTAVQRNDPTAAINILKQVSPQVSTTLERSMPLGMAAISFLAAVAAIASAVIAGLQYKDNAQDRLRTEEVLERSLIILHQLYTQANEHGEVIAQRGRNGQGQTREDVPPAQTRNDRMSETVKRQGSKLR